MEPGLTTESEPTACQTLRARRFHRKLAKKLGLRASVSVEKLIAAVEELVRSQPEPGSPDQTLALLLAEVRIAPLARKPVNRIREVASLNRAAEPTLELPSALQALREKAKSDCDIRHQLGD